MVKGAGILDQKTNHYLICTSKTFFEKEDRSIMFAGISAITLDSVGPVSKNFEISVIYSIFRLT